MLECQEGSLVDFIFKMTVQISIDVDIFSIPLVD